MSGEVNQTNRRSFLRQVGVVAAAGGAFYFRVRASAADSPEINGRWSPIYPWPDVAIHLHLLPSSTHETARLMSYSDDGVPGLRDRNAGFSKSYLVNIPQNGVPARTWAYIPNNVTNLFCSGHTFLPDGRLFAMGGHNQDYFGAGDVNFFAETPSPGWETQPNALNAGRWYPSVINLPNKEILVVSGTIAGSTNIDPMPQVWKTNEGGGFRDLTTALRTLKTYPKIFVAPNGRVVSVGSEQLTSYLDTSGTGKWSNGPKRAYGNRNYGAAVLYDDGKILIAGGATTNSAVPTATAEVLDLNAATPAWRYTQPMANARKHCTATLLPDGTVLVTGGSRSQLFNDAAGAIFAAELWNPATETWSLMASAMVPRVYHSTALLLPDGRVLSAGGGRPKAKNGGKHNTNVEIFEPPYLFRGPRPTVTDVPASAALGSEFSVATPDAVVSTE